MPQINTASEKQFLVRFFLISIANIILTELAILLTGHWRECDQEHWFIPFIFVVFASSIWIFWPVFRASISIKGWFAGLGGTFICVVALFVIADFYGNTIMPRFVHPELKKEMDISFARTARCEQLCPIRV